MFKGGKVIASGGYGCIFEPALSCLEENDNNVYNKNKISKIMITKNAKDEFKQIEKYNIILSVIPNYNRYFLINNFQLCKPNKLTKNDLKGYQKKCKVLNKKGINAKNINQSLDKVMIINMPNGGIDVEKFIQNYWLSSNIIRLNNSLIDLLVNGIQPMNKLNVYHCDIKDTNVLVQVEKNGLTTRLIDWGLSVVIDKSDRGIPRKLYRRPFQYNVPFSSILFNVDFIGLYYNFMEFNSNPDYFQIREFIINYIFIWNDIRGPGHLSAINDIVKKLTINELTSIKNDKIKEHLVEYNFTYYYIVEYLSKILEKYTKNKSLDLMSYFEDVFLKNIDIWGFTMIYVALYEYLYESFNELNEYQMKFMTKIKYIIIHFLYENPTTPINVSLLANELTSLNELIEKFEIDKSSKKLEYVSILRNGGFTKNKKIKTRKLKRGKKEKTRKRR